MDDAITTSQAEVLLANHSAIEVELATIGLDAVGVGFAVVRPDGRALVNNRTFVEALRPARRGLFWQDEHFRARRSVDMRALTRLLESACTGTRQLMRVDDLVGSGALEVIAAGLPPAPDRPPCASILVREPAMSRPEAECLVELYGLTPAEAGLAVELVQGGGLTKACKARAIAVNTGKGYLQRIFQKTGTRRQSELTALVLQGVATFGAPQPLAEDITSSA